MITLVEFLGTEYKNYLSGMCIYINKIKYLSINFYLVITINIIICSIFEVDNYLFNLNKNKNFIYINTHICHYFKLK